MKNISKLDFLLFIVIFSTQLKAQSPGGISGNLELWLKANAGLTLSGADVTNWSDQATTDGPDPMAQGTTANQPDRLLSALNFNPVIDFDGADDFLSGGAVTAAGDDDFTYIVVWKADALKTASIIEQNSNAVIAGNRAALATTAGGNFGFAGENNDAFPSNYGVTQYQIATLTINATNTITSIKNGLTLTGTIDIGIQNTAADAFAIGRKHSSAAEYFDGKIAEVIVYSGVVSAPDRRKIESYLAIKYGISLDQTTATNYTSALETDIWNATANTGYNNDVTGIGRDDLSGLSQTKSKNENIAAILTIANGNIATPTSLGATDSWLLWGSNNAATTFTTTIDKATSGTSPRMERIWKVQETGTVGLVEIAFSNSLSTGITSLIVHSSDQAFPNNSNRTVYEMENDGTNYRVKVNFNTGDYFTFAQGKIAADPDIIINEIVSTPRQDWSGGGFYNVNPAGAEDNSDEWVELYINKAGLDLTNYAFEFDDGGEVIGSLMAGGAFEVSNYFSKTGGLFKSTKVGDYLVLGNPTGSEVINATGVVRYFIRDANSKIIDQVTVATGEGTLFTGNSTDNNDESISRMPNRRDTNVSSADFIKTRATLGSTNSPSGIVKINEVITDPQQDWSTTNFNGVVSGGGVTDIDEWIELYIDADGINLTGWTIRLIDGSDFSGNLTSTGAFDVSNYTSTSGGTFINTKKGDYLVLGNPDSGAMNNDVLVILTDADGNEIDRIQLSGAGNAPDGNATTINNESVSRYFNGKDTNNGGADFIQTKATMAATNSKSGVILINEVVTNPVQDWSTNNFNGVPAGSTISDVDEWIELYIGTAGINLTGWSLLAIDSDSIVGSLSAGGAFDESVYTGAGSFFNTQVGDYLVLGNAQSIKSINNTGLTVQIKDAFGTLIDQVKIGGAAGEAPTGNATSRANESVARIPNGTDTNTDNVDFVKANATLGKPNATSLLGLARNALQFDGDNDFVSIPTNTNIDFRSAGMAVEFWLKTTATNAWPLAKGAGGTANEYFFQIDGSGFIKFGGHQTDNTERSSGFSTSVINDNNWHHIAGVYTGTNFQIYVDGKLQNQTASVGTLKTNEGVLHIGKQATGNHFAGLIDEVRIWQVSRTHEQVLENMFSTVDQGLTTLGAYYRFDQTAGITLPDIVTNSNNDGTLTNMAGTEWTAANWPIFSDNQATFQSLSADVTSAPSNNLTVSGSAFLNDDNDILLIGHDNTEIAEVNTDLPANTLVTSRYGRSWHLTKNDVVGTANGNVQFSFNSGAAPNSDYTYYLLERAGTTGDFAIVPIIGTNPSGHNMIITVNASQLDNGSYYTIGRSGAGVGNALAFDGGERIDFPNESVLDFEFDDPFTIEVWLKNDATLPFRFWKLTGGFSGFYTEMSADGRIQFLLSESTTERLQVLTSTAGLSISANNWTHLAVVYDGSSSPGGLTFYFNGKEISSVFLFDDDLTGASILHDFPARIDNYDGTADEMRIWDDVRTQEEIIENMFSTLAGNEPNLRSYYRFNQGIGDNNTSLPDLSGNENVGTLVNFTNLGVTTASSNYVASDRSTFSDLTYIINATSDVLTNTSGELTIASTTADFLQDTNDQIIWWNDGGTFTEAATDLPTGTLVTNRIIKTWRVTKNDAIGTAHGLMTFSFDLGTAPNSDYTYYLLSRIGTSGDFSVVKTIGSKPNGNSIEFTVDGAQITDENYFTLGRSNAGPGNTLDFDGSGDFVNVNDNAIFDLSTSDPFTFEFWLKAPAPSSGKTIFSKMELIGAGKGYQMRLGNGNSIQFQFLDGDPTYSSSIVPPSGSHLDNEWYHLAITHDGNFNASAFKIYINGTQVLVNFSSNLVGGVTNSENFTIGSKSESSQFVFDGLIDEFRFWSDVRSSTEILQNMYRSLDVANESNLVAYYKFNQGIAEGTNTGVDLLTDYSGNNHSGTLTNFALASTSSNWVGSTATLVDATSALTLVGPGNALDFDGVDDRVALGAEIISPATFTVEAWVNAASFATSGSANRILAIDKGSYTTDNPFAMFVNDAGKIGYVLGSGDANNDLQSPLEFSPTLATSIWYHVALTFDGTTKKLYVDGVLYGAIADATTFTNTNTEQLLIGDMAIGTFSNGEWEGLIDEVRIWNSARTTAEIQSNMYEELLGNETGLVAYYRFDQVRNTTTLPDETTNSNTGTLQSINTFNAWVSAADREPFKTTNSGTWESASTWKSRTVPNLATSKIYVKHAVTINSDLNASDIMVGTGGSLDLAASQTLTSAGNLINNGTITGTGTLKLTGTNAKIGGNSVSNLKLSAATGQLFTDFEVTGNLDLSNDSKLAIGDHDFTINTISNFGSGGYIVSKDTLITSGFVKKNLSQAHGNFVFPLGTADGYTPVSIVNLGSTGFVNARVFNDTYKEGTSGDIVATEKEVNKSWEIKGDSGVNVTITLQWNATDEDANYAAARGVAYMSKNDYKWWLPITPKVGATGSNPYQITASGISTFSVFGSGTEDSTLPVTWLDFVAHENEFGEVVLDWSTASELDNEKFEIERSVDGKNFETLGVLQGSGTTTTISEYQYLDRFPLEGLAYYRIKQVDFDGKYDYSEMLAIQLGSGELLTMDVFPNRTYGKVNIKVAGNAGAYQLMVLDLKGQLYGSFELTDNARQFDITSFPAGIYLFKIATVQGTLVRRIIKQ